MSETPDAPAAGWYADPERIGAMRYWDGSGWIQQQPAAPLMLPPPLGRSFALLSRWVTAGLTLTGVLLTVQVAVYGWGLGMFEDAAATGDVERLELYDNLNLGLGIGFLVIVIATGVTWLVWQSQLARSAAPGELERSPGAHVGSWFIPIANFVLPCQNVLALWRTFVRTSSAALVGWWWAAFVIGGLLSRLSGANADDLDSISELESAVGTDLIGNLVEVVAAILAVVLVRRLTLGGLARSAALSSGASPAA
jgi:hypothetical protein